MLFSYRYFSRLKAYSFSSHIVVPHCRFFSSFPPSTSLLIKNLFTNLYLLYLFPFLSAYPSLLSCLYLYQPQLRFSKYSHGGPAGSLARSRIRLNPPFVTFKLQRRDISTLCCHIAAPRHAGVCQLGFRKQLGGLLVTMLVIYRL